MSKYIPTDEQNAILGHPPGSHGCVEAGPGTGKSATVVALIESLQARNAPPRIRLLTFTRAATAELAKKVGGDPTSTVERPSTIHSFAISVLVRNPGAADYPTPLRMADDWEDDEIVRKSLARRMGAPVPAVKALLREMEANWQALTPDDDPEIDPDTRARFVGVFHEHREVLGYTLLSELPYLLLRAMTDHPDLVGLNYDLLVVDEYQDLNACDIAVLTSLAAKGIAVLAAGDEDQSIYSFRKAAPEGIRRFAEDYPGALIYPLSLTKRCGKRIVAWARWLIEGEPDRHGRPPLTPAPDAPDGEVALLAFASHVAEARGIANLIENLIKNEGLLPGEILVLHRGDKYGLFSKPIKEDLARRGIPVADPDVVGRELERTDNRRSIEIAHLLVRPDDPLAWASLVHLTRGAGATFFDHIYRRAVDARVHFAAALLEAHANGYPEAPRSARVVQPMVDSVLAWLADHVVPTQPLENGWGRWLIDQLGGEVAPCLSEELAELVLAIDGVLEPDAGFDRFLNQITPLGKDLAAARDDGVRFMSMASSKGLTVRATIVAAVEEGLVPRPQPTRAEERRLLYVAMTRSREYVFCTWARRRRGPTARAGQPNVGDRRSLSSFLQRGPVLSEDGQQFLARRWPDR